MAPCYALHSSELSYDLHKSILAWSHSRLGSWLVRLVYLDDDEKSEGTEVTKHTHKVLRITLYVLLPIVGLFVLAVLAMRLLVYGMTCGDD